MREIQLKPKAPDHYSEAEKSAWVRGYRDGQVTGEESLHMISPYDVDGEEAPLYEAWQAGYDAAL
jgi:hypothetical protein